MGSRQTLAACLTMALLTTMCLTAVLMGHSEAQPAPAGVGGDEREEETPRIVSLLVAQGERPLRAELSRHRAQVLLAGTSQGAQVFEVYRYGAQYDIRTVAGSP